MQREAGSAMRGEREMSPITYDYIIVGAGSAGCLLANRLTADRRTRVLLLEAGGQDDWIWFHIPIGYVFSIFNPRADWCYRTEAEPALAGRSIPYPRGKVVGGSSAINGMIYMRGAAADFDQWRQLGLTGWGWDDVLPYFKAHEDFFAGADQAHGSGGELRVDPPRVGWPVLDAVKRAAVEAGIRPTADFNRGEIEGIGPLHVNQRRGVRFQAAKAFLRQALARPNLTLETGVLAERVRLDAGRAVGVDYRVNGTQFAANARAEVILAAGSIGSPQLLMLSGIGPGAHLAEHGIEVKADRPGVGGNLHDHMQVPLRFTVEGLATFNERYHSPLHRALMTAEYALLRRGALTMAPSQLGIFTRSSPDAERADIAYVVVPYTRTNTATQVPDRTPGVTLSFYDCRPTSRGDVRLKSADPASAPAIRPNYLATGRDQSVAANGMRVTRSIMRQPSMRRYNPREFSPGDTGADDNASLLAAAAGVGNTVFHPVGTCKMGRPTDPTAVVDERLRLIGVGGLRVIDASVMPEITSGNTNAPTMMIAEKGAAMILQDAR
jgi:choline dehydrogenase-like flavoprotein